MAVHVVLNRDQIRSILSLYHLEGLEDFGGIAEGSINTSYWVRAEGRKYFLRITEKKRVDDMIFEKELLGHLARHGLPVPRLVRNVAKGTFTPWSSRGRFVSLFEYMPGRDLGVFEVRPRHARAVGHFAASMHVASAEFPRARDNEFSIFALGQKLERITTALEGRRISHRLEPDVRELAAELARQKRRKLAQLPLGTVHGDLFVDNVRFEEDRLVGVIDFEMASTEKLIWDVAVAINAWCWQPSARQMGGPAGRFDLARTRHLIKGYAAVRELSRVELAALPDELRLAAARFAITRLVDFELKRLPADRRVYKDYRHYMARLSSLSAGGAEELLERSMVPVTVRRQ